MDYDSPDVAKDFPGLYASESGKLSNGSDFSDGDHDKLNKKENVIARKKDHKKDKGYAALAGESSPEEFDNKSGSKLKKSKAFMFSTKKEKREKSREKNAERDKEKDRDSKEDKDKKKDKDKKDKDKKEKKDKDKDKKDKKIKHNVFNDGQMDTMDLGDVQPIFGVPLELSVEHNKCHDNICLPIVVRNCIDYIQGYGLQSDQLYKIECSKVKLQHLKKLYNNHENVMLDDLDVPTACTLLKSYLRELPDSILTAKLAPSFEEASSIQNISNRSTTLLSLVEQLPAYNKTLLSWIILHFDSVIQHQQFNKLSAHSLSTYMSPILMISNRLLKVLLFHCKILFPGLELNRYVPPLSSTAFVLPKSPTEIMKELQKQDSLLSQIHSEMNAGFISSKREEQLWEVQRIITQLKRQLRLSEKRSDNSDDVVHEERSGVNQNCINKCNNQDCAVVSNVQTIENNIDLPLTNSKETIIINEDKLSVTNTKDTDEDEIKSEEPLLPSNNDAEINIAQCQFMTNFVLEKCDITLSEFKYVQMKVENMELLKFVTDLQYNINNKRTDIVKLRIQVANHEQPDSEIVIPYGTDLEGVISSMIEENQNLEQKRMKLIKEVFDERKKCVDLKVELAMLEMSAMC